MSVVSSPQFRTAIPPPSRHRSRQAVGTGLWLSRLFPPLWSPRPSLYSLGYLWRLDVTPSGEIWRLSSGAC